MVFRYRNYLAFPHPPRAAGHLLLREREEALTGLQHPSPEGEGGAGTAPGEGLPTCPYRGKARMASTISIVSTLTRVTRIRRSITVSL